LLQADFTPNTIAIGFFEENAGFAAIVRQVSPEGFGLFGLLGTKDTKQAKGLPLITEDWDLLFPLWVLNTRDFNILPFEYKHGTGK
jgi:hypothetical protein